MIDFLFFIAQNYASETLFILFSLLIGLLCINYGVFVECFGGIKKTTWILLLMLLLFSFFVRVSGPSCPATDGKLYEHVFYADKILKHEPLEVKDIGRPKGYPFILSIAFFLFGKSIFTITSLNLFLSVLTIFVVFLLAHTVTKNEHYSLFASLIFSLMPLNIFYSMYCSQRVAALFFVSLAFLLFFIAVGNRKKETLVLAILAMLVAFQLSPITLSPT